MKGLKDTIIIKSVVLIRTRYKTNNLDKLKYYGSCKCVMGQILPKPGKLAKMAKI